MFFCQAPHTHMFSATEYLGRALSDHSPLLMKFTPTHDRTPIPSWRLDPSLLEDEGFHQLLAAQLTTFFIENVNTTSSPLIEWEAFKVFVRGQCLGQTVGLRRTLDKELGDFERRLGALDMALGGGSLVHDEIAQLRSQYNATWDRLRTIDLAAYRSRHHEEGGGEAVSCWLG